MKTYCVYILASRKNGTLYIGVTSDLKKRVWQHKEKYFKDSFTSKYGINRLVYFECGNDAYAALKREKRLKRYSRQEKIDLIEETNPDWHNLFDGMV